MAETAYLEEIISKNIERIRIVVHDCSTESIVGYSMVKHQQGFPEVDLSSPTKQIHLLLGIMLETGETVDAKEFTDREWEQIVEPLERLGHAYMSLYWSTDEVDMAQSENWRKRQLAMTAFLDYHQKGLMASTEQVSDRIRSYLAPFDDRLSDTFGISASEALNIAHYIEDQLQQQMDQLGQYASNHITPNEYPDGLVRAVQRLGKIRLTELVERYGETGKAFWNLFSIRRVLGPLMKYPTERSIVESKPLIRITDDIAMLFNVNILFNAVLLIGEETLANDKIGARFFRHRDNTLEGQTAEAFQRMLGDQVEIYKNVFETPENQYEHDLLVVSQDVVLSIGAIVTGVLRRGGVRDYKRSKHRRQSDDRPRPHRPEPSRHHPDARAPVCRHHQDIHARRQHPGHRLAPVGAGSHHGQARPDPRPQANHGQLVPGRRADGHRRGHGREKLTVIGILSEEGADLSRVIFGHSDPIANDMDLMLEMLAHGVYIEFDLMGRVGVPLRYAPDGDDLRSFMGSAGTAAVAEAIPRLIEAGCADRILLSQDVSAKMQLKKYGGTGYSFILEKFLPELRSRGVSEEHIQMMMVENPKRILTFVEPQG